jgi:hypothetical protein
MSIHWLTRRNRRPGRWPGLVRWYCLALYPLVTTRRRRELSSDLYVMF